MLQQVYKLPWWFLILFRIIWLFNSIRFKFKIRISLFVLFQLWNFETIISLNYLKQSMSINWIKMSLKSGNFRNSFFSFFIFGAIFTAVTAAASVKFLLITFRPNSYSYQITSCFSPMINEHFQRVEISSQSKVWRAIQRTNKNTVNVYCAILCEMR